MAVTPSALADFVFVRARHRRPARRQADAAASPSLRSTRHDASRLFRAGWVTDYGRADAARLELLIGIVDVEKLKPASGRPAMFIEIELKMNAVPQANSWSPGHCAEGRRDALQAPSGR